jgi:hypothetical protein
MAMAAVVVQGASPFVPPHLPRARPRWWCATGELDEGALRVHRLTESDDPPGLAGVLCGLCAPCSLPAAFLDFLGLDGTRAAQLAALAARTPNRLYAQARRFAADRPRGARHPRRVPEETASALERRRLARFAAALPLLRAEGARPWDPAGRLFEVDAPLWLHRLGVFSTGYAGASADAVRRRVAVLAALQEGAAGFEVDVVPAEFAAASAPALEAVVACTAAAWLHMQGPEAPGPDAPAWIPTP